MRWMQPATLYRYRWGLLLGGVLLVLAAHWLIAAEMLLGSAWGLHLLMSLKPLLGVFPALDHGLPGVMGIYPRGWTSYGITAAVLVGAYWLSLLLYFLALRHSRALLDSGSRLPWLSALPLGMMAALLTTAAVATMAEVGGFWNLEPLGEVSGWYVNLRGLAVRAPALLCLPILLVSWVGWIALFRRRGAGSYPRQARSLLRLFVITAGVTFVSGLISYILFPRYPAYWAHGTYTGFILSLCVLLWSVIAWPVLLFKHEAHRRWSQGLCMSCGYDLRGSIEAGHEVCPECESRIPKGQGREEVFGHR